MVNNNILANQIKALGRWYLTRPLLLPHSLSQPLESQPSITLQAEILINAVIYREYMTIKALLAHDLNHPRLPQRISGYEAQVYEQAVPKNANDYVAWLLDESGEFTQFDKQRQTLENRLKRAKKMFEWNDHSPEDYKAQRDQVQMELAALPPSITSQKETVERLANYLQSIGKAWREGNQEQKQRLAQTLFNSNRVENDTIKGVTPQIEFTPLLVLNQLEQMSSLRNDEPLEKAQKSSRSGSDGIRTRGLFLDREAC